MIHFLLEIHHYIEYLFILYILYFFFSFSALHNTLDSTLCKWYATLHRFSGHSFHFYSRTVNVTILRPEGKGVYWWIRICVRDSPNIHWILWSSRTKYYYAGVSHITWLCVIPRKCISNNRKLWNQASNLENIIYIYISH